MANNFYEVLGVDRKANDETIKKAYRELARKWHPDRYESEKDKANAEAKMKAINEAYDTLSDKDKRAMYDLQNPVSADVYEHYAKKQPEAKPWYKRRRSSSDSKVEKEKKRKAIFQFLELEYQHRSDIFEMFTELANGAVSGEFSDEDYRENLELILEEADDCISKIQGIIEAAKERKIEGMEAAFKQAQDVIEELTRKCDETPRTLKKAHYVEETKRLAERIQNLMEGFGARLDSITDFDLLAKTWEFHNDNELNAARARHKQEVDGFLEDIKWIKKTANERNLEIGTVTSSGRRELTLDECQEIVQKSSQVLSMNLQGLRQEFWKKCCSYTKSENGEITLRSIGSTDLKGDFVCPSNVSYLYHWVFYFEDQLSSISIPAYLIRRDCEIDLPRGGELKSLVFTFGQCSQTVNLSNIDAAEIRREGDYILVGDINDPKSGFALIDAENVYVYDEKKLCKLNGVKTVKQLESLSELWGDYSGWVGHKLQIHTWAQAIGKLSDPYIMRLLPVTTQAVKEWNTMDKTNFEKVLSKSDKALKSRVVRLYIALGALNGGVCHAQAEYLISKLNVSAMYRSRLERCPGEKQAGLDPVFSVPKAIVDFVEENMGNKEFLPYVFAFLEGHKLFESEAKKANVKLSDEFVIQRAAQCIFHSKVNNEGVEFTKQLLEKERTIDVKIADRIMQIYSFVQRQAERGASKNIIQTIDMDCESNLRYRFLELNAVQTYIMLCKEFMFKERYNSNTAYYGVEAENVFTSSNSHAIEIVDGENNNVAVVILNLFDKGELFADIVSCENKSIDVLEAIRRAVIDQMKCNKRVTGISIGMNEAPRVTKYNKWRKVVEGASVAWAQEVKWIKFEYRFESRVLGTSNKAYRVRFMVDGEEQYFDLPNPYDDPRKSSRNRRRGWW